MKYTAAYERDEDGVWVGSIVEIPGCHTQGRTIEETRERLREAICLFDKDWDETEGVLVDREGTP